MEHVSDIAMSQTIGELVEKGNKAKSSIECNLCLLKKFQPLDGNTKVAISTRKVGRCISEVKGTNDIDELERKEKYEDRCT